MKRTYFVARQRMAKILAKSAKVVHTTISTPISQNLTSNQQLEVDSEMDTEK